MHAIVMFMLKINFIQLQYDCFKNTLSVSK